MKKLTQLLKESQHLDYRRMNVGEEENGQGMTKEEKRAFVEAVAAYRQLGEMISHKGNISEIHDSIKGIVENANNLTLKETGDWFDRVTVQRHMKSMNESFKVFSNTIKEVSTLQQRLESSYDEIGEVLGKYYEIKEGNEFGAERAKAIAAGNDSFEVDGKSYKVTGVDAEDKKNAEKFSNESMKLTSLIKRNEELTGKQKELDVDSDGDIEADDLADLRAGKKADESVNEAVYTQKIKFVMQNSTSSFKNLGNDFKKAGLKYNFSTTPFPHYIVEPGGNKKVAIVSRKNEYDLKGSGIQYSTYIATIKESVNEGVSPADMDKIKGAVEAASSFMSVGSELKKLGMKYTFATEPLPIYIIQPTPNNKVAVVNKKYATKPDFVVGDIAVGIMEGKLNEEEIKWDAVQNAIINFLKMNTKILDKRVQAKDTNGVKGGLKSIISGLVNAQRNLKLESVNEASYVSGYTVKAKTPYEFVNGAYAVLNAYLRDEELGPKGKRELQDIIKSLEYMRKYFFFNMTESVNELKKLPSGNFSIKVGYPTFADYEKKAKTGDTILRYDKRGGMIKAFVNGSELDKNAEKYLDKVNGIIGGAVFLTKKGMKGVAQVPDYEKKDIGVLVLESKVNEDMERQLQKIASLTGLQPLAIKQFGFLQGLNFTKILKFVEKGKLSDRMDFVTAVVGNPGNPIQKKMIKMFQESVNERIVKEKVK